MTKIAIQPNASGSGTFTLTAPNSNVDRTFSLPDATGEVLTDQSNIAAAKLTGDVAAGRITTALNAGGSAPIYAARAWVNFNGTGTVAIRASGNVSSITDNGVGNYTVNFTTALADANYAIAGAMLSLAFSQSLAFGATKATSSCQILTTIGAGSADFPTVDVIFVR